MHISSPVNSQIVNHLKKGSNSLVAPMNLKSDYPPRISLIILMRGGTTNRFLISLAILETQRSHIMIKRLRGLEGSKWRDGGR